MTILPIYNTTHTHTHVRTHAQPLPISLALFFSLTQSLSMSQIQIQTQSLLNIQFTQFCTQILVLCAELSFSLCSVFILLKGKKKKKKTQTHTHTLVLIPIPASAITPHFLTLTGPHLWHATPLLLFSESDLLAVLGSDTSCKYTSQGHLPYIHIHTLI